MSIVNSRAFVLKLEEILVDYVASVEDDIQPLDADLCKGDCFVVWGRGDRQTTYCQNNMPNTYEITYTVEVWAKTFAKAEQGADLICECFEGFKGMMHGLPVIFARVPSDFHIGVDKETGKSGIGLTILICVNA